MITVFKLPSLPANYNRVYPFEKLNEINMGFFVGDPLKRNSLASAASKYSKRHNIKLITRTHIEDNIIGVLVVRIK